MQLNAVWVDDHAALHCLLTIDDQSSRLMSWSLWLAEFDFDVKYKNGKMNTQVDPLSRLYTSSETVHQDGTEYIPAFELDFVNAEPNQNRHNVDEQLIDVQSAELDDIYAAI